MPSHFGDTTLGRLTRVLALTAALAACVACADPASRDTVVVSWAVEPETPSVGARTRTVIRLADEEGRPLTGAQLQVEGHMLHPGMAPVVVAAVEGADGLYEAHVHFTMAGAWTMVAAGTLADGRRVMETFDVPAVR